MTSLCWNENSYYYRPDPFRIDVRRLRLKLLFKFHSCAAAVARPGCGLCQGFRRQPLHVRGWRPATSQRITLVDRPFRAACPNNSRCDDLQHLDISHLDGSKGLFPMAIIAIVLEFCAPDFEVSAQQSNKTPDVVVHGGARSFRQEVVAGKYNLVADEPVSA